MNKPKTLFKYQGANMHSLKNFRQQALYMASPRLFNDPFDCSINFELTDLTANQIARLRSMSITEDPERFKRIVNSRNDEQIKAAFQIQARRVLEEAIDNFLSNSGVSCFSQVVDDLLLWGHYGESFKGYCIEFRTEFEPFTKLQRVQYKKDFPSISSFDLLVENNFSFVNALYCTKSISWQYEKEWRILHAKAGTLFHYNSKCIKAIYFGPRIDPDLKEILCLILSGQIPEVELWEGKLSDECFGIRFNQFHYTTYCEAKRKGLA